MEVIAQLRIASVMFLAIVVLMRLLAGTTQMLAHRKWGERSMGRAINLLHSAFLKIHNKPELLLDYEFVINIFQPLFCQLPEFHDYMDYFKEQKEGNVIGSPSCQNMFLSLTKQ